jgi:hypothetical protein
VLFGDPVEYMLDMSRKCDGQLAAITSVDVDKFAANIRRVDMV